MWHQRGSRRACSRPRRRHCLTPIGRAISECRMQFPRPCVASRIRIVGIATFVDAVESSLSRIACETAPRMCARRTRGPASPPPDRRAASPSAPARTRARSCVPGQRRPCAYREVDVRIKGLPRIFSGSRASSTRGQAPSCPHRRPPHPRHRVVDVCRRGGLHFGRNTAPNRDLTTLNRDLTTLNLDITAPNGGTCAVRGARLSLAHVEGASKRGELQQ